VQSLGRRLLFKDDLDRMFFGVGEEDWRFFTRKRLFVTGGSGFIGKWLLSALLDARRRLELGCDVVVLTRSAAQFVEAAPHIATAHGVTLCEGDVRSFAFPEGAFDVVVHCATDIAAKTTPIDTFSACVDGTRRVLDLARQAGAQDLLLTSSGAVYGTHPPLPHGLTEGHPGAPDPCSPASAYGEGKRASEWLACAAAADGGPRVKIARIYAQVGPYLPLDKHFAIGNFIADVLAGRDIIIRGDGTPTRSYLYAADTTVWLWKMLVRGASGRAWNVGGDEGISIAALAQRVGQLLGSEHGIKVLTPVDPSKAVECYVPDTSRARTELGVKQTITLDDSIRLTANWIAGRHRY
jgi:nucleoside-diphosphate-sugar epimerase